MRTKLKKILWRQTSPKSTNNACFSLHELAAASHQAHSFVPLSFPCKPIESAADPTLGLADPSPLSPLSPPFHQPFLQIMMEAAPSPPDKSSRRSSRRVRNGSNHSASSPVAAAAATAAESPTISPSDCPSDEDKSFSFLGGVVDASSVAETATSSHHSYYFSIRSRMASPRRSQKRVRSPQGAAASITSCICLHPARPIPALLLLRAPNVPSLLRLAPPPPLSVIGRSLGITTGRWKGPRGRPRRRGRRREPYGSPVAKRRRIAALLSRVLDWRRPFCPSSRRSKALLAPARPTPVSVLAATTGRSKWRSDSSLLHIFIGTFY